MEEIDIKELRSIQLEILQTVHDFCIKNNIHYSLSGGTLLGAVRHKGYIPWDDDIDIMMPRPDYECFHKLFNAQNNETYKFIFSNNEKQYFQPFGKIVNMKTFLKENYDRPVNMLCVYIDVFPVDGLPNNKNKRQKYWKKIAKLKNINTLFYERTNKKEKGVKKIIRLVLFYLLRLIPANSFSKVVNNCAKKNTFSDSECVACSVFGYGQKEEVPKSIYDNYVLLDFEGKKFYAMQGYDIYLHNLYGDYMQLPPVEKRVAKHDSVYYWR